MNMKKMIEGGVLAALMALVVSIFLLTPAFVNDAYADTTPATGTLSDSVSWSLDNHGNITIFPTNNESGSFTYSGSWRMPTGGQIKSITVLPSVTYAGTNASQLFSAFPGAESIDLSGLSMPNVANVGGMFLRCYALKSVDLSGINMTSVTNASAMFMGCASLKSIDLSGLNMAAVTNVTNMFNACTALETLNLSDFDASHVQASTTTNMFTGCASLRTITVNSSWAMAIYPFASQVEGSFYRIDDHSNRAFVKAAALPVGQAATYSIYPYMDSSNSAIPLTLTLKASTATNTAGMTFTFNPIQQSVVTGEEGAQTVPRWDSNNDGIIDSTDDYVLPQSTTLTALAMDGYTQEITGSLTLPDPGLFNHAGVYAYEVSQEIPSDTGTWDYSQARYKVRLYVVNGENGLEYGSPALRIESLADDNGIPTGLSEIAKRALSRLNANNEVPENGYIDSATGTYRYRSDNICYSYENYGYGSRLVNYALTRDAGNGINFNELSTTLTPRVGDLVYLPSAPAYQSYNYYPSWGVVTSVEGSTITAAYVNAGTFNRQPPVTISNGTVSSGFHGTPVYYETPAQYLNSSGAKVQSLAFTNVNTATTNLQVTKDVTGAYGNHAKEFPFTLTVNLPSWAADDSFAITTTGTLLTGTSLLNGDPAVTTASGTATVTFNLTHGQSLSILGLPVGTTFSTSETDSTDGVNVYVPSATYRYDGASNTGDFATNTTNYAAALDSNNVPATNVTVNATAAAANASTMLGEGAGNLVTVTNDLSNPPSPTGIATAVLPYALMMAVAAGALLVLRNRKRDDDLA